MGVAAARMCGFGAGAHKTLAIITTDKTLKQIKNYTKEHLFHCNSPVDALTIIDLNIFLQLIDEDNSNVNFYEWNVPNRCAIENRLIFHRTTAWSYI